MPTLTIGDKQVTVGDDFLKLPREQQDATVEEIAKSIGASAPAAPQEEPISVNNVVRAAARGVPGTGWMNKLEAKTNAALAPALNPLFGEKDQLKGDYAAREAESLRQLEAKDKAFEEQHPIVNTVAELGGGAASLGGVAARVPGAARAMGFTGGVKTAVPLGMASGAAIDAADELSHGHAPTQAGLMTGALTGGGGVVAGKALGKVWDAARGVFRDAPAVPTRTLPVNGVEVPVRESVVSRNPNASEREQGIIHGAEGPEAQAAARAHGELTDAAMGKAHANLAASLDPTGASPAATPMAAGEAVGSAVSAQEAARAAAEAGRLQAVGNETNAIRTDLNTSPTPGVLADTPRTAAELVQQHLINARDAAAAVRDRAYETLRGTVGEFNPAAFQRISARIRQQLSGGTDPVKVSDTLTPHTAEALRDIEMNVGQRQFENQVQPPMQMGPDGRPVERPITADVIDEARKRLISMQRAANQTARRTGDFTDVRGMRRVISEFDNHVQRAAQTPGGFSGDPQELLNRLSHARASHSALKRDFGPANPQDLRGKAIEKIVGKRDVDPADAQTVQQLLFGNASEAGGPQQVAVARHIIDHFGADSRQVAALKQGLLSHLADTPAGLEAMTHEKVADRIHKFFSGGKGVSLAQTLFSPSERARLLAHANRMRVAADPAPSGFVEKTIAKWAGRDGNLRASPKTIVDDLIGSTGQKGTSPLLAQHLKRQLSPEAFGKLKQGVWSRITEAAEGKTSWQDQKVGNRIMEFLNGDGKGLADAMFTKAERDAMRNIADAHIANLPVEGTTNPSKSGHVMQRLARGAAHGILPFVGLHAGGLPGVATAFAVNKAASKVVDRVAANNARKMFYGPQAKAPAAQLPQRFGALGGYIAADQSR